MLWLDFELERIETVETMDYLHDNYFSIIKDL
jgi:hypothetical protein